MIDQQRNVALQNESKTWQLPEVEIHGKIRIVTQRRIQEDGAFSRHPVFSRAHVPVWHTALLHIF
jgi:hypothetical protein